MQTAIELLDMVLKRNMLRSRVDEWMDEVRKDPTNFYADTRRTHGLAVAEEELGRSASKKHKFAVALTHIAEGIKALSQVKPAEVVDYSESILYPNFYDLPRMDGGGKMIVAFNPNQGGWSCSAVTGSEVWGTYGTLGLKAIVIGFHPLWDKAMVDLVLPLREEPPDSAGYVIVRIGTDGYVDGKTVSGKLVKNAYLFYTLGMTDDVVRDYATSGGMLDHQVGFPGAHDYIAKHIKSLPTYLTELAKKLSPHKH